MLKRLRIKFICINMLIVTVMLSIIFGTVFHFTRQNLELESMRMMQSIASGPFRLGRPDQRSAEIRLPYFTLEITQDGKLMATGGGYYDLSDEEFLQNIIEATFKSRDRTGILPEYNLRYQRVVTPAAQRIVFADMSSEQSTLNSLIKTCAMIGAVSFLAFFLISLFLAYWAIKPVEQAWIQQRQFVADASHELKTPLTVILTNAELLQSQEYDEKSRSQFSGNILSMAHQMRGLVESLLELARVDSGKVKAAITHVDLSKIVADAVLPFEPLFFEQNLEIQSDIEPSITLKGSEAHLRQVTEILLDNAMKYSTPSSTAQVTLKRRGPRCLLSVSNSGEPISQEDLKNIFKRFYRTDKVRSMNHSYGLGLAIAESIIHEHHGRMWAESKGGRNTFFVELLVS